VEPTVDPDARLAERDRMVSEQLVQRGIRVRSVIDALRAVPREIFVPASLAAQAYDDCALPVECDQTISQPYMVACMTELLELAPCDRVLEIGTGTGYQTAVLAQLTRQVFTVERHEKLLAAARERLESLGIDFVRYRLGDGSLGWPEFAPFDAILVAAGSPSVPDALREQLACGGRLVIPVGWRENETLTRIRRTQAGFLTEDVMRCRFVKLVGAGGWKD
jgi:protein-L-isoaspartate(D-aspartate) O-methyltransferase